jgi:hypothetical protein
MPRRFCILGASDMNIVMSSKSSSRLRDIFDHEAPPHDPPWPTLLWVAAAAALVVSPQFFLGNASGHDIQFHLASWMEAAQQWHQGILYPHWARWANFGFGEPRFIFYPPLSWFLGAALGLVLPWKIVPGAFIWIALMIAGASMHRLAREWLRPQDATAAAVLYAVNPYHLVIVYYRSDFAELLAIAFLPLLILQTLMLAREGWRRVPHFAIVFAAIWLTNAPAAVIATYTVAIIVAVEIALSRSLQPLLTAAAAGATGFALAAFYIVPAVFEQRWVEISQALAPELQPWHNFLFVRTDDPEFVLFNLKVSAVALIVIGIFAIAAVFAARRRQSAPAVFWSLWTLGIASILLMFPWATWFWRHVPELEFVQFPWRWLMSLAVAAIFFFCAAIASIRRRWIAWLAAAIFLVALAGWMATNNWWDDQDAPFVADSIASGTGYQGTDEYQPLGCDRTDLPDSAQHASLIDPQTKNVITGEGTRLHIEAWGAERKQVDVDSPRPVTLVLQLIDYPAWRAKINGAPATIQPLPDTAVATLPLAAGPNRIELQFKRTPDRTIGDSISLAAAIFLLIFRKSQAKWGT